MNEEANKKLIILTILFIVCLPAIILVFGPGFYSLHDDLHVIWLDQMDRAIKNGQFPPRWVPDLSFAYGYPLFNFVYPLPFYLGEIFHLIGLSLVASIKAVFIFSIFASAFAMFLFLSRHFSLFFAFLGAILYVYTPYRAVTIFVRGTIGEASVFALLPLELYCLDRLAEKETLSNQLKLGTVIALLILAHNIGAFMSLPFLLLYGILLTIRKKTSKTTFLALLKSIFFGGILSAFFWLPALIEKKYLVSDTVFNFIDHFPFIKQLLFPSWGYGISVWGPNDGMSFQIGVINLLTVLISLAVFLQYFSKKAKKAVERKSYLLLRPCGPCRNKTTS